MASISAAQLKLLATEYMFNFERAKAFLAAQKRESKKKVPGSSIPAVTRFSLPADPKPSRSSCTPRVPRGPRGPTGYNLFVSTMSPGVKVSLAAKLYKGQSLPPRAAITEVARQWKALPDAERLSWNRRAALV